MRSDNPGLNQRFGRSIDGKETYRTLQDMIDWMESIPFSETRNYVQRVMEGLYVYRSRLAGRAGPMTIRRDLGRGAEG